MGHTESWPELLHRHHIKAAALLKIASVVITVFCERSLGRLFSQPNFRIAGALLLPSPLPSASSCEDPTFEGLTSLYRRVIKARFVPKSVPGPVPLPDALRHKRKSDAAKLSTPNSCLAVEACSEPQPALSRRPFHERSGPVARWPEAR